MRKQAAARLSRLAEITLQLQQRLESGWPPGAAAQVEQLRQQYEAAVARPISTGEICDQIAQTVVCTTAAWPLLPRELRRAPIRRWLIRQAHPLWRELLSAVSTSRGSTTPTLWDELPIDDLLAPIHEHSSAPRKGEMEEASPDDPLAHLFERFLATYKSADRKRWGVFFTPLPIVRAMMRHVNDLLTDALQFSGGFGELCSPALERELLVVDPAAGSGAFLAEAIHLAHQAFALRSANDSSTCRWQSAVQHLAPRLIGYDVLLPACALAQLLIAARLSATGFEFRSALPLNVLPHNTLSSPDGPQWAQLNEHAKRPCNCMVVVGNPPFAGISLNDQPWAAALLRGKAPQDSRGISYFHVDGLPLGERKVWLNDDYVKFFRYAHWKVEEAGRGLIAFVSNHAYLDNATFRGMRASLLKSFPHITIVDLHGSLKRRERDPAGGVDENVFAIEQGVSIGYFVKRGANGEPTVLKGDFYGSAIEKLGSLAVHHRQLPLHSIRPRSPHYLFVHRAARSQLPIGMGIDELMPAHCTAPITARDHFIVAIDREELVNRLRDFADLTLDDEFVRSRYFRRTRSRRYAAGDTRGWKLSEARRRLAECPDAESHIRRCLYRPFDMRYVFWTDWMIDWPRPQLARQSDIDGNWFLVTRRQMLPEAAPNFFWISAQLAIDGVIRSDNRGSESLFPIYASQEKARSANFSMIGIEKFCSATKLAWKPAGAGDLRSNFGPEDIADYLYALFWSSEYRISYAELLCTSYPRALIPRDATLFSELAIAGRALRDWHLQHEQKSASEGCAKFFTSSHSALVDRGFPKFRDGTIWINGQSGFAPVDDDVWLWKVGAHQVCRKWLSARKGRELSGRDIAHLLAMLAAAQFTNVLASKIDNTIAAAGGLCRAFE